MLTVESVNVSWDAVPATTIYDIYRGGAKVASTRSTAARGLLCPPGAILEVIARPSGVRQSTTVSWTPTAPEMLPVFRPPPFTPTRTTVVTTANQFDDAWIALRAGDMIDARGIEFAGERTFSRGFSSWAEVHFDAACRFTGAPAGSKLPAVWAVGCRYVRFYGGDVTGKGNDGIRIDDCDLVEWRRFRIHDTAGTGLTVRGITGPTSNLDLQGEITNCGLDLTLDPHPEKGTGNHGCNVGGGTGQAVTASRLVLSVHDQPYGAALEVQGFSNSKVYLEARRIKFQAKQQTAGNAIQVWGPGSRNLEVAWLRAVELAGRAVETDGLDETNAVKVTWARATSVRLQPAYATDPRVVYADAA